MSVATLIADKNVNIAILFFGLINSSSLFHVASSNPLNYSQFLLGYRTPEFGNSDLVCLFIFFFFVPPSSLLRSCGFQFSTIFVLLLDLRTWIRNINEFLCEHRKTGATLNYGTRWTQTSSKMNSVINTSLCLKIFIWIVMVFSENYNSKQKNLAKHGLGWKERAFDII